MTNKNKALIAILAGAVIGGAISSVMKIEIHKIPPFTFTFLRFLFASLVIIPFFIKEKIKFDKLFLLLIILSVLPVINIGFFVVGLMTTTASISQMLYGGSPILTSVFAMYLLKTQMSLRKWIFILVGLVGVLTVILLPLIEKNSLYRGDLKGNLLILIGVISYSIYGVISKKFQNKYSPITITSVFIFLCTFVFLLLSLTEMSSINIWLNKFTVNSFYSLIYVSVFSTVGTYLLGQYAIKYGGPVLSSLSLYLVPIFAYISAYLLLGEKLTAGLIIGTIITLISVCILTYLK